MSAGSIPAIDSKFETLLAHAQELEKSAPELRLWQFDCSLSSWAGQGGSALNSAAGLRLVGSPAWVPRGPKSWGASGQDVRRAIGRRAVSFCGSPGLSKGTP